MENTPLITVIVAVYSAEKYIKRCLDSILCQSYENWNAILVEDCSKDNTLLILEEYAKKYPKFTLIKNEKNLGVAKTRNRALKEITGEYVAFLDADDWWEPDMLSSLLECSKKFDADIVQCKYAYDYENGLRYEPADIFPEGTAFEKSEFKKIYKLMMTGMRMNHICMKLYKAELLVGKTFSENVRTGEDLLFNIEVIPEGTRYAYIPKAMYHYFRVTTGLTSASLGFSEKWKCNRYISKVMWKRFKNIGMNNPHYAFCIWFRPYRLVISKAYRMIMDKLFMSRKKGKEL